MIDSSGTKMTVFGNYAIKGYSEHAGYPGGCAFPSFSRLTVLPNLKFMELFGRVISVIMFWLQGVLNR